MTPYTRTPRDYVDFGRCGSNLVAILVAVLLSVPAAAAPGPSTGFQADIATGVSIPEGDASGAQGDGLGDRYSYQIPLNFGIGGKPSEQLYFGGYLGLALGWEGSDPRVQAACDDDDGNLDNDIACSAYSVRVGLEGRYAFSPGADWNPWIGYGFGVTAAGQTIHDRIAGRKESTTASGWEVARLSVGVDARKSRVAGWGPVLIVDLARFPHSRTYVGSKKVYDGGVEDPAVHAWVTLGVRLQFFP